MFCIRWFLCLLIVSFSSFGESKPKQALNVVTSGGFAAAFEKLSPQYEALSSVDIKISYGSSSGGAPDSIPERLKRGEEFDLIILSKKSLNQLTSQGFVEPSSRKDLVHSYIGMAIKDGRKLPDISSEEAFIKVLMEADSIGYSASASGTYLSTKLWPEMGIWHVIQAKSKRILSERVASVVARGDVEIGFQQISEIIPIEGVQFVAPIPKHLQKQTTFSSGVIKNSTNKSEARKLLRYLASEHAHSIIKNAGLTPAGLSN